MLQASDVWFGYDEGTPVVRGVSLAVPPAGIIGILGPNGSGKTTLLRMLAGTRQPQRGADHARRDAADPPVAHRARPPHGGRAAGDPARVRLHRRRSRDDGPLPAPRRVRDRGSGGSRGDRGDAGVHRDAAPEGSPVRHAQRRRKAARRHRRGAGTDFPPKVGTRPAICFSTSPRRRSISVTSSKSRRSSGSSTRSGASRSSSRPTISGSPGRSATA